MTPKQKAREIIKSFVPIVIDSVNVKQCALVAVQAILDSHEGNEETNYEIYYHKLVKEEISKYE